MRLKDKVAIVTGAASGFGEGIAKRYAEEGAKIVVADINDKDGARVVEEIRAAGGGAEYCHTDVSQNAQIKAVVEFTTAQFGGLDIMVNNAGWTYSARSSLEVSEDEFDKVFAVNVKSLYLATLHAIPVLRAQGRGGVVINIASTAGVRPRPNLAWYNASKGAAVNITKSLAVELARDEIRVCAINPVIGETGLLETFMGMPDTPENRKKFLKTIPLGRFSTPLDVANAALFLASDEAEFLTGVCLEVDGGRCV